MRAQRRRAHPNTVTSALGASQGALVRVLNEHPPATRLPRFVPAAPAVALAPAMAPAPPLAPPALEHSSRGVKPAFAQSLPNTSDCAGQLASHALATGLSAAHASGPRTQDK